MKAKLVDRSSPLNQSFSSSYLDGKNFFKVWHYHPELELVIILESKGTQFVGDSIERFKDGDVLLIGKNLPHLMLNDNEYFEVDSELPARAIVINFERYFTGNAFLSLPEMKSIDKLLSLSERGIKFSGQIKQFIREMALNILSSEGFERILLFIKLLYTISNTTEYRLLSSPAFSNSVGNIEKSRMGKVYDYVMNNFDKAISLKRVFRNCSYESHSFFKIF